MAFGIIATATYQAHARRSPQIVDASYEPGANLDGGVHRVFDAQNQVVCYIVSDAWSMSRKNSAIACLPVADTHHGA